LFSHKTSGVYLEVYYKLETEKLSFLSSVGNTQIKVHTRLL